MCHSFPDRKQQCSKVIFSQVHSYTMELQQTIASHEWFTSSYMLKMLTWWGNSSARFWMGSFIILSRTLGCKKHTFSQWHVHVGCKPHGMHHLTKAQKYTAIYVPLRLLTPEMNSLHEFHYSCPVRILLCEKLRIHVSLKYYIVTVHIKHPM